MADFDIAGAKRAGYTEAEIVDHLSKLNGFNAAGARQAGYSDSDIISHLFAGQSRPAGEQAARIVGAGAQAANDSITGALTAPFDASAWVSRQVGLVPKDTPTPSQMATKGIDALASVPGMVGLTTPGAPVRFEPEQGPERVAANVGGALGTTAATLIPGMSIAKTAAPGMVKEVATAMTAQPRMQATSNVVGNVVGENDPLLGAAAALAVPAGIHGLQRTFSAAPAVSGAEAERRALLGEAQKEGIPVSFGKIIDSKPAQFFESVLSKLPFVGNRQQALNEAGKQAFNKAALDKVPLLKGEGLDAATPGAMQAAFRKVSDRFDDLAKNTEIKIDGQFGAALQKVESDYSQQLLSQINKGAWDKLQELKSAGTALNAPGVTGVSLDGRTYQNIRSQLSSQLADSTDGQLRRALGGMIEALDDVASRSIPKEMAKDWQEARRSWRVLSMIDDSVRGRHNAETAVGNISPGSLHVQAGKDPQMEKLSRVGMRFVGDKTPDSGTPMRQLALNVGGLGAGGVGAAAIDPLTAGIATGAGYGINALLNNPVARAALIGRLNNPTEGVMSKGLVATLAAQRALQEGR